MIRHLRSMALTAGVLISSVAFAQTKDSTSALGFVHLGRAVTANGQPLAAGTYQVRLTSDMPTAVVGESPDGEQWVEFVKGGTVAGKEVATVISSSDIGLIAKGPRPSAGMPRVDLLKGGEYYRVWIVQSGHHYLINLRVSAR